MKIYQILYTGFGRTGSIHVEADNAKQARKEARNQVRDIKEIHSAKAVA